MIKAEDLVTLFRQTLSESWGYIWGTAGGKWTEAKQAALEEADTTPLVERAIRLIDDNIRTIVTVDEVADVIGYNRDYLSRQFLASCGMTVKKYIDQKKLSVAKHLLVSSKMSVGQVARAVGFDDVQHFYKFFRYHEKVSPNQFRKLNG